MSRLLRSAWTIARRDYVATVGSRLFLLFLVGPLFPVLFGVVFGAIGAHADQPAGPPVLAVIAEPSAYDPLLEARTRLALRLGPEALPDLKPVRPAGDPGEQALALAGHGEVAGALTGAPDHPRLYAPRDTGDDLAGETALLLDQAGLVRAAGGAPAPIALSRVTIARRHVTSPRDRADFARIAQTALFAITVLLATMLLSNMVEEKSNKVIEVLAAAVPVDAIFLGKLAGMLAISLTGIAVWGITGGIAATMLGHGMGGGGIIAPAVGWPVFAALTLFYFSMSYLLLGAVFLGLGSQAASPREVQVLSMPVTMIQLLLFAFASIGVAHPQGGWAIAAAIFPWSSPLAMLARGAELPTLWTHAVALLWQAVWFALAVWVAARRFRVSVLKSGGRRG